MGDSSPLRRSPDGVSSTGSAYPALSGKRTVRRSAPTVRRARGAVRVPCRGTAGSTREPPKTSQTAPAGCSCASARHCPAGRRRRGRRSTRGHDVESGASFVGRVAPDCRRTATVRVRIRRAPRHRPNMTATAYGNESRRSAPIPRQVAAPGTRDGDHSRARVGTRLSPNQRMTSEGVTTSSWPWFWRCLTASSISRNSERVFSAFGPILLWAMV